MEGEHEQEQMISVKWREGTVTFSPALSPCGLAGVRVPLHAEGEHEQEVTMSVRWREGTVTQRVVVVSIFYCILHLMLTIIYHKKLNSQSSLKTADSGVW